MAAADEYGFDVSGFLGDTRWPAADLCAEHFRAALSEAAGCQIEVSDARIEGTILHVNVTMPRYIAQNLGLVPVKP